MTLRKLCNHPDLVTKDYKRDRTLTTNGEGETDEESGEDELISISSSKRMRIDEGEVGCDGEERYGFWRRSGKMIVVEALLNIWARENHKVLLFTQTRQVNYYTY